HLNNDDEQGSKVLLQKKDHIQPSELHDDYKMIEPWKYSLDDMGWILFGCPQHSVYLDKEKKVLLLIGNMTVQVWHNHDKKKRTLRTLEFISVIVKSYSNDVERIQLIEMRRYPIVWRLLDFYFDLLSILIDAKEYSLIKYLLFSKSKDADDVNNPEKERIFKILDCIASKLEIEFKILDCIASKLEIDKLEIENQFSQDI
ncbi:10255_t:CDS:2, partial [Dentiscutata erythropus]